MRHETRGSRVEEDGDASATPTVELFALPRSAAHCLHHMRSLLVSCCWPMISTAMMMDQGPPLPAFLSIVGTTSTSNDNGIVSGAFVPTAARRSSSSSINSSSSSWARRRAVPRRPRLHMQDFSSSLYWNKLYAGGDGSSNAAQEEAVSEWHVDGEALIAPLERLLGEPAASESEELAILNVGCGTSTLWASMYDRGWRNITNIDFSAACIEQGRPLSADRPGVQWLVMDACSLTFADATFDAAIDKGTLDAIACSEAFDWFLPRMARCIVRVLRPGGTWVCVSFTPPSIVLPLLEECGGWRVEVEMLDSFWMYVGRKMEGLGDGGEEGVIATADAV